MRKIAVVGLGAIGAQVLWQLSQSGAAEVHGFDLHTPGHGLGASGGDGRLFRYVQYEAADYVPLLKRSEQLWQKLTTETGQPLREITGGLILGTEDAPQIVTSLQGIDLHGLDAEVLQPAELRRRFPYQTYHDDDLGILDKGAGVIRPELTNLAAIEAAIARGAVVHRHSRVKAIDLVPQGASVTTVDGASVFDHVVVATGAWIRQLSPTVGAFIQPRKVTSAWFFPRTAGALAGAPGFVRTAPAHYYGVPSGDGLSIKIGLSGAYHRDVESPDDADYVVRPENLDPFAPVVEEYFPGLIPEPFRLESYFEGYTADARPIMQYIDADARLTALAGFSGHGFKFAPVYGQIGANLALHRELDPDIAFLARDL